MNHPKSHAVDFIGLGAQKAGTSWVYACLYEHPEICAQQKELHFFSRSRYEEKGLAWYEAQFAGCAAGCKRGEFSTSYLSTPGTAARIAKHCPEAKLIAIVRNPVDRAYSQYRNAIKAGEIRKQTTFEAYIEQEPSVLSQGRYAEQLARYFSYFSTLQLLVLVYEDSKEDPVAFIRKVYEHLGVDPEFVPVSLRDKVKTTRFAIVERLIHYLTRLFRKLGLNKLVPTSVTDAARTAKTEARPKAGGAAIAPEVRERLAVYFREDTLKLNDLLDRDVTREWGLQ